MVKVYGVIKSGGAKFLIGTYTKTNACKIMMDNTFIQRYNDNHFANIYKLIFEMED